MHVIVETARGVEYGYVVVGNRDVEDDRVVQPLKPVIRMATEQDDQQAAANKEKEKEAFKICKEKIKKHGLEMKLIDTEYTFDNNKVLFYSTADGRIDFRQSEFLPVSIKMAKEQNLSLNPTKISGVCGRLMCCLKHEQETYEDLNSRLPGIGDYVTARDGSKGEVSSVNVLRQLVKVIVTLENEEKEIREYKVEELRFKPRRKKEKGGKNQNHGHDFQDKELKELEALEKKEGKSKLNDK